MVRGEDAQVENLIGARAAHESRQAGEQVGGAQLEVGRPVAPGGLDGEEHGAVAGGQTQGAPRGSDGLDRALVRPSAAERPRKR